MVGRGGEDIEMVEIDAMLASTPPRAEEEMVEINAMLASTQRVSE